MSGASGAFYGRLGADPRAIETRTGTPMTVGNLAVDLPDRSHGAEEGTAYTLWLSVCAFGRVAEDLARCGKGQCVSVSGRLAFKRYRTRDGEAREGWQILADTVVSAATQRPRGGGRKRQEPPPGWTAQVVKGNGQGAADPRVWGARAAPAHPFDDAPPF